mgnify:CR=1 FL=1
MQEEKHLQAYQNIKIMNVVVTGASRGIGYQTVLALNREPKNKIIALARNEKLLQDLKKEGEHPENIHLFTFDLRKFQLYNPELVPQLKSVFNKVDVLINNAGFLVNKPFQEQTEDDVDAQMDLNFKAPFLLTQTLLSLFSEGAHVINISSMGGVQGSSKFPGLSVYSAAKGALAVLTELLAEELKNKNVKTNCLALGAAQTEMLEEAFPGYQAPVSAAQMGSYVADFALNGHQFYNGKILPVALSTP